MVLSKTSDHISIIIKMPTLSQDPPASSKAPDQDLKDMGESKTSDHIQIKIKMPNSSQEPPASSKAPNEEVKDMDVLCTFKIKMKIPKPIQEPPGSSKTHIRTLRTLMFFAITKWR